MAPSIESEAGERAHRPCVLVVMGVSGSGKTTIALSLATRLGWRFQDADALHSAENIARMHAGVALTDADRAPWLAAVAGCIDGWRAEGVCGVIACSALKRAYRRVLVGARPDVGLVYLKGDKALIAARLAGRAGHFMPAALLDSQFAALEEPGPDENPIVVSVEGAPEAIVDAIMARLPATLGSIAP